MYVLCDCTDVETLFALFFQCNLTASYCALITVGVHEKLIVTRLRFLLKSCPRLISVTLTDMREKSDGKERKKPFCQIFTRQPADRREFIEYWRFQGFTYKDVSRHCKTIAKGNFRITDLAAAFFFTLQDLFASCCCHIQCIMLKCLSQLLWFAMLTGSFTAFMRSITIQRRRYTDDKY